MEISPLIHANSNLSTEILSQIVFFILCHVLIYDRTDLVSIAIYYLQKTYIYDGKDEHN